MSIQVSDRPSVYHAATNSIDAPWSKSTGATRLSVVLGYMLAIEFLTVAISTYVGSTLYHYISFGMLPPLRQYIGAALFIAAMFTAVSLGFRHFTLAKRQQLHMLLWSAIGAVALTFVLFLAAIFLLKISTEYSRGAFIFEIASVSIAICISRTVFIMWLRSAIASGAIESRRTILVGNASHRARVTDKLKAEGIRVVDSIPLPRQQTTDTVSDGGHTFALSPSLRKAIDLCRTMSPDDVVILAGQKDLSLASDFARSLSELPCNVHIAPIGDVSFLARSHTADLGSMMTLQISRPPLSLADLAIKRTFDIIVAVIALIVLSPLLLVVALAIKLNSRGNVLFRQKRHGYNNEIIRMWKFRSMTTNEDGDGTFIPVTKTDDRITAVGRILRRTNIDELPQLLNVLVGEMSIVGPRPHAIGHNEIFENQILPFARRHNVKPGITGWAQVNGYRGPAHTIDRMRRRVEYDLYYIDNWSFFFDLKIIMMTLFSRKAYMNAY